MKETVQEETNNKGKRRIFTELGVTIAVLAALGLLLLFIMVCCTGVQY